MRILILDPKLQKGKFTFAAKTQNHFGEGNFIPQSHFIFGDEAVQPRVP
jgi:hypothetical protein